MKTNRLAVSASTAVLTLAGLIACSPDQSTSPTRANIARPVFDLTGNANAGSLEVCKNGTAASFTVTFSGNFNNTQVTGGITPAGGNAYTFSLTAGQCLIVYNRPVVAGVTLDPDVNATVVETAPVGGITFVSVATTTESGNPSSTNQGARSGTVTWNMFHDARVTFTNAPPSTGCTYTKGWYRNKGSSTVIAADGRTIGQAQQIFDATPGQPGNVTFQDNNELLNLYQQLLAAINNLGGNLTAGPTAVDVAVAAALAGTGGTGTTITTTLTQTQISDLIDVLSAFNEGEFTGWPHCDD